MRHQQRPHHPRGADEAGERALQLALFGGRNLARNGALQRRPGQPAQAVGRQKRQHQPAAGGKREQHKAHRVAQQADNDGPRRAQLRDGHPHQPALHQARKQPHHGQRNAHQLFRPAKFQHRVKRPHRLRGRARQVQQHQRRHQPQHCRVLPQPQQRSHGVGPPPFKGPPLVGHQRLRQHEEPVQKIAQAEPCRHHERHPRAKAGQQPAQRRPNDEAHAEGRAHQAKILRSFFGRADVGDVGRGRGEAGPGDARQHAPHEQPGQRRGKAQEHVVEPQAQ